MEFGMILVDFSQVMISNIMMQLANNEKQLDEEMVRHMVLSSLRLYKKKFGDEYFLTTRLLVENPAISHPTTGTLSSHR
jgi:hypothetical protein